MTGQVTELRTRGPSDNDDTDAAVKALDRRV